MKTFKFYENELQPEVSDNKEGGEILGQRFLPLKVHLHLYKYLLLDLAVPRVNGPEKRFPAFGLIV
jgi:hypothetical protein